MLWLKITQRQNLLKARSSVPDWYQQHCAQKITKLILNLPIYQQASCIALYQAIKQEISLEALFLHANKSHKTCVFPILNKDKSLQFGVANEKTIFKKNRFEILEPTINEPSKKPIDIYFIPLVGFDSKGNRLGMGAGYYDRTLAKINNPFCVGIAYSFQQLKLIPSAATDHKLDLIITEKEIIKGGA